MHEPHPSLGPGPTQVRRSQQTQQRAKDAGEEYPWTGTASVMACKLELALFVFGLGFPTSLSWCIAASV